MTAHPDSPTNSVLGRIEEERRRDRFVRRVAFVSWGTAGLIAAVLAILTALQIPAILPTARMAGGPGMMILVGVAMPFILFAGALSMLGGTLATIGIFMRMRSASLEEIQLRLATLEELLTRDGGPTQSR